MQKINLYPSVLDQSAYKQYHFSQALVICGIVFCAMIAASFYSRAELDNQLKRNQVVEAQIMESEAQYHELNAQLANRKVDRALEQEVDFLAAKLKRMQSIYDIVDKKGTQNEIHASEVLKHLATNPQPDLWLTHFSLNPANFTFEGRTLDAEAVPEFVEVLRGTPAYQNIPIQTIEVMSEQLNDDAKEEPNPDTQNNADILQFKVASFTPGETN